MVALGVIPLIVLAAIFAPFIAPADPYRGSMLRRLRPIGFPGYPLGGDELGRDMLTRLIYGGRLSLFIGVMPVLLAFCDRLGHRRVRGLRRRQDQHHRDAHHRRVLRFPLGAAGDRAVWRAGRRHPQFDRVADDRVHPADRPRRPKR